MKTKSFKIEVGALLRSQVRDYLFECLYKGKHIVFHESNRLFESTFFVKGKASDIDVVNSTLINWGKRVKV
jgi:hypothetical protein